MASARGSWRASRRTSVLGWTMKNKDNIAMKGMETVRRRKFLEEAGNSPEFEI